MIRAGVYADAGVGTFQVWVPFPVKFVRIINATAAAANPAATCLGMVTVAVPAFVIPQHVIVSYEKPITVNGQ